jgi:hypothetical protein
MDNARAIARKVESTSLHGKIADAMPVFFMLANPPLSGHALYKGFWFGLWVWRTIFPNCRIDE